MAFLCAHFDLWPKDTRTSEGDYFCKIEAPDGTFQSLVEWRNFSNPIKYEGNVDKCNIYDLDYKQLDITNASAHELMNDGSLKNCTEFDFDFSKFESSIVTDFSLVCGNSWQVTLGIDAVAWPKSSLG